MRVSELKKIQRDDMGFVAYNWMRFKMLFDLEWQYECWLGRRLIHHIRKADAIREWLEEQREERGEY